jgi:hypothetical protein
MVRTILRLAITLLSRATSVRLWRRWRRGSRRLLRQQRAVRSAFEDRLRERWRDGLDGLELLWLHAYEEGERHNAHRRPNAAEDQDFQFDALARLHGRSCRVASEILALLRTGHAEGAHARWRTLHEIATTMFFLSRRSQETAERYLLHHRARAVGAAEGYQRHCHELGYEPLSAEEMEEIREQRDTLVDRFGRGYAKPYGWAAETLNKQDPKFVDIEKAANMDRWRPWFRMASEGSHAGSHSLAFTLGLIYPSEALLAGPSNAGLTDPGASVAISLSQATVVFLTCRPAVRDIAAALAILRLATHTEDAFMLAGAQLDEQEERERAEGRGGGISAWQ